VHVVPGRQRVGEEVAALHGDAIAQFGVGDLVGRMSITCGRSTTVAHSDG
jgi:hypothetical protein